jgi:hypothetical protein
MENLKKSIFINPLQTKYFIKSSHDIFEDSYENGEGKQVNSYRMEAEILAGSPAEALEKYSSKILGFDLDSENLDIDEETGLFWANILVDKDNMQASIEQVEKWKKDEIALYSDFFNFRIYELTQITKILTL